MTTRYCYVSMLSTDDYFPGARVLHHSLQATNPAYPFLLLLTPNVSAAVHAELAAARVPFRVLDHTLLEPGSGTPERRWAFTFAKLHVFGLAEFEKVVFLDADMLIRKNIDGLFDKPHMCAVNAGGLLPEKSAWTQFNSGLLVVEPSLELFGDMRQQLARVSSDFVGGDQDFLHNYFPEWPNQQELHLDHRYNIFDTHLDRYEQLFGWGIDQVRVVHFIGETKPWHSRHTRSRRLNWSVLARGAKRKVKRLLGRGAPRRLTPARDAARHAWAECHAAATRRPA